MTTAAIRWTPSTTVFERESPLEYAEQHRARFEEDQHTGPPAAMLLDHEISRFQRSVGAQRDSARRAIIRKIVNAQLPDEYIETTLQTLIGSTKPGRLDDAVDILSEAGAVLPQFVCEALTQSESDDVDEDYWYVLTRAIGKSKLPTARIYVEMLSPKSPEAAVEAFGDIGDSESLDRLRAVAKDGPSDFIRQMAAEMVEECSQ